MLSRFKKIRFLLVFLLFLLAVRVYSIQSVSGEDYTVAAALQRFRNVEIYSERGDILDRNGIKLTNRGVQPILVIQPDSLLSSAPGLRLVSDILNVSQDVLRANLSKSRLPYTAAISKGQAKAIADADLEGLGVVDVWVRNDSQTLAPHILGYVNEKGDEGLSGLEKSYQGTLSRGGGVYAGVLADASDSVMLNYGYRIWNTLGVERLNIKTTLDYHMQTIVEDTMDRMVEKGAVVIVDILNGDILAIASRPGFNPATINRYLNDEDQPLFNRALGEYTPGSIFKIVTAAAALEKGILPTLTFDCPGYVEFGGLKMKCWTYNSGGHGTLNMARAFQNPVTPTSSTWARRWARTRSSIWQRSLGLVGKQDISSGGGRAYRASA
jgi:cell division protein FtsI/penicillin-binding protein 2